MYKKGRKTVSVEKMINKINTTLKFSIDSPEQRKGVMQIAETMLLASGNYNGYRYLTEDEVPIGELPGERVSGPQTDRFENTDSTRVEYAFSENAADIWTR